jgi:hypothetical protein
MKGYVCYGKDKSKEVEIYFDDLKPEIQTRILNFLMVSSINQTRWDGKPIATLKFDFNTVY